MDAMEALGDSTRRAVVDFLARGEATAGEIASQFPSSRPAISRHLRVLRECGLVEDRAEGTKRIYAVRREGLLAAREWFSQRLDALDTELRRQQRD